MINQQTGSNSITTDIDLFEEQSKLRSLEEFRHYCQKVLAARLDFEKRLSSQGQYRQQWQMTGYSEVLPFWRGCAGR